jgi:hypothetical protein
MLYLGLKFCFYSRVLTVLFPSQGYVVNCYSGFTPEQLEFMCNIYERYRVAATGTDFCFMDLIIEFNDSPGDITVHVENNGIYYYDEEGTGRAANERFVVENVLYTGPGVRFITVI